MSGSTQRGGGGRRRNGFATAALAVAALAVLPAAAAAVTRPADATSSVAERAARTFFDSRSADRGVRNVRRASRAAGSRVRSARAAELRRIGAGGKLQLDALTGTPRSYQNLSGTLSGPASGRPAAVALRFARSRAAVLGLSSADLDALGAPRVVRTPSGISSVRFTQRYRGVPAYDNDLRINLDRANRVISVTGSPVHGLSVASVTPRLSAAGALSSLMRHVAVRRDVSVRSTGSDARRTTRFSNGDVARLVLFHGARGTRLAWHLSYDATSQATYDAIVDASSGAVLRRANMVKHVVNALVFDNYPGAPGGGTQRTADIDFYLNPDLSKLDGPFAHTWLDLNDDNVANAGEEVSASTTHPFTNFNATTGAAGFCQPTKQCSWNPAVPATWDTNKEQTAVQAHYYVSHFHDHLFNAPIGFDAGDGNFAGVDRVNVNANDGAATGPDPDHVNNANMSTPPDGTPPRMQMFLFEDPFRAMNGDDDARIVYHEYTHGLSNRLITSDGFGAVSSPQSGAMGEAWSDWYAVDLLEAEGHQPDTAASGEVDMGAYTDPNAASHLIRFSPLDCPPNATGGSANCAGGADTGGPGGFTYADFGHVCCSPGDIRPEVHSDGEIWAQTLWDFRDRLIADLGSRPAGIDEADRLVTEGMRLSPPEPSFLDMRNAILAADSAAPSNGSNRTAIWEVFANRGMGFFAAAADGSDVEPIADFSPPPPDSSPKGEINGVLTDEDTGLPIEGALVGVAGHTTDPTFPDYLAGTTAADGRYAIPNVPEGTYPVVAIPAARGYDPVTFENVAVTGGAQTTRDAALRRDWAGSRGGALISGNDDTGADFGCGQAGLIDQSLGIGYSPFSPLVPPPDNPHPGQPPFAVVELPRTITVESFGVDPGATCGDDQTATTKDFRIETSSDGVTFGVARSGAFAPEDAHRLNILAPTANATNVKFVKITSLSAQGEAPGDSGRFFYDLSEFEVYGNSPNVVPSGSVGASPNNPAIGQQVTLTASFTDPDSAITGYGWDFDGNGTVDRNTTTGSTTTSYATGGARTVGVFANDFRGGSGSATTTVTVQGGSPGADPVVTLSGKGGKRKVRFTVTCALACKVGARLTATKKQAKRLRVSRKLGRVSRTLAAGETRTITVKLKKKAARKLKRRGTKRVRIRLSVAARYADGRSDTASKKVRIRI